MQPKKVAYDADISRTLLMEIPNSLIKWGLSKLLVRFASPYIKCGL